MLNQIDSDYLYSKAKSVFKVVVKDIYDFEHTMFVAAKDEETAIDNISEQPFTTILSIENTGESVVVY